ncbi:MAG TPA: LysM peptidoglycan-binding domain-containing protein, partial [Anaerolineales bacterium]|nr:LysM peptidoglycan-binding domain-containing protein [Anaerolineales bacterium]
LQEGRADDPALLDGLVHLYANFLFQFAWEITAPRTENPIVRRLLARRLVTRALTDTLTHLHRFQEQPDTFLWLLRLTCENAPDPHPLAELTHLATFLAARFSLSPENLAYILNIPERHPALKALDPEQPPAPPADAPSSAERPATFEPLPPAEIAALIEQIRSAQVLAPRGAGWPRFTREFLLLGVVLFVVIQFIRNTPNRVVYLPTPLPPPTATPSPWEITPVPLPTAERASTHVYYENPNPYLVWQLVGFIPNAPEYVLSMATSPTEPLLAVGDSHSEVTLWDLTTFSQTLTLTGHTYTVHSLAFSPDGHLLASGDGAGLVQLWEMPSGTLLQQFEGHPKSISALAFSPDGQALWVASGRELWVWGVNNGVKLATYTTFKDTLTNIAISPDGSYWAVSLDNGTTVLARTEEASPLFSFETSIGGNGLAFSPDGKFLVALSPQKFPIILPLDQIDQSPQILKTLMYAGEEAYIPLVKDFVFSPDGRVLAAAVEGASIYLWDTQTWTPLQASLWTNVYTEFLYHLVFSFDGKMLIMNRTDGEFGVWELRDLSTEAGRLLTPRYFTRLAHDFQEWTYVYPDFETTVWGDANLEAISRVSEDAGFTVKLPMVGLLDNSLALQSLSYEPHSEIVFANFWADEEAGALLGFTLQESKIKGGEQHMTFPYSPFVTWDTIGLTALIEPVQLGPLYGELLFGGWTFLDEENPDLWNQTYEPGDEVTYISRWSESAGYFSLRWQENDILYEIEAYGNSPLIEPGSASMGEAKNALIQLAQTMYAPEEVSLPWNIPPYFYTVAVGDTCARLAERFYTNVETIRALNRLGSTCILSAGQTLLLPTPAERFATTDLNCDRTEETLFLLHDPENLALITGVALENTNEAVRAWTWHFSAADMGVASLDAPEIYLLEEAPDSACEQFLILTGGRLTASQTRIFQWNGAKISPVLAGAGRPYSTDYSVAALPQTSEKPFTIPLIQYIPATLPSIGPCPNQVTEYTWNGVQFRAGVTLTVSGECAGN